MRPVRGVFVASVPLVMVVASACGGTSPPVNSARTTPTVTAPRATPPMPITAEDFDPKYFGEPTKIDNEFLPLQPGTQFVFRGGANDGKKRIRRQVVFTVTDLTKVINGVRTLVTYDLDYNEGELVEADMAFFAQDNGGNVWYLGEYPEEHEEGKIVATPAWIAGLEGAKPGIFMMAAPRVGTPSYSQGWGPAVDWTDRARVYSVGQDTCVPSGCYQNVLVTDEYNPDEPGRHQLKFYAPGVGNVRVGWRGAREEEKETLALVKLAHLDATALARVRERVLDQENRGYVLSKDVYGLTPHIEPLS
jgi:hypothetical protein